MPNSLKGIRELSGISSFLRLRIAYVMNTYITFMCRFIA